MSSVSSLAGREARLKPEFAQFYPSVLPGQWISAATMTVEVAKWLLRTRPGHMDFNRILSAEHFEFRGESPRLFEATA